MPALEPPCPSAGSLLLVGSLALLLAAALLALWAQAAARSSTEARHARQLAELVHRLKAEAIESRSRLIRTAMHNLRSPLMSLSNYSAVLKDELASQIGLLRIRGEAKPDVCEAIESLCMISGTMQTIVTDMLNFESLESGRLMIVPVEFRLHELTASALAIFGHAAAAKGISLEIRAPPAEARDLLFTGDRARLEQVVHAGLSNAMHYTEPGGRIVLSILPSNAGRRPSVLSACAELALAQPRLSSRRGTDPGCSLQLPTRSPKKRHASALFELEKPASCEDKEEDDGCAGAAEWDFTVVVADSGVGLSAQEVAALNLPLAALLDAGSVPIGRGQLHGRGGAGLGIAIAQELMRLHYRSELHVSSRGLGLGTTFTASVRCALPPRLASPSPSPPPSHPGTPTVSAPRESLRFPAGFRALHVEDDMIVHKALALRTFKKLRVPYAHAENGADALARVERGEQFALIVMDNQMPVMRGAEATRRLRALGYTGYILGMTADVAGCADRLEFEKSGVDTVVDKTSDGVHFLLDMLRMFAQTVDSGRALQVPQDDGSAMSEATDSELVLSEQESDGALSRDQTEEMPHRIPACKEEQSLWRKAVTPKQRRGRSKLAFPGESPEPVERWQH